MHMLSTWTYGKYHVSCHTPRYILPLNGVITCMHEVIACVMYSISHATLRCMLCTVLCVYSYNAYICMRMHGAVYSVAWYNVLYIYAILTCMCYSWECMQVYTSQEMAWGVWYTAYLMHATMYAMHGRMCIFIHCVCTDTPCMRMHGCCVQSSMV